MGSPAYCFYYDFPRYINFNYNYCYFPTLIQPYSFINQENKEENKRKLKSMLDNCAHKFRHKIKRKTDTDVITINNIIEEINQIPSSTLGSITSHKFYITIQDLLRDLLNDLHSNYKLNQTETNLLHNCILFFNRLINAVEDVTLLKSWLFDPSLINTISNGINNIKQLIIKDKEKYNFKEFIHLINIFNKYYKQSSFELKNDEKFHQLFEATMNCLLSSNYDQIFRRLKSNSNYFTTEEKFFLIQCPSFIISNNNANLQTIKIKEQILQTMIPRYASILDKHIKTIDQWNTSIIRAINYLLLTVIYAKGYYTPYANGQPIQWLIDHIICIIKEPNIIEKIDENSLTPQTILIDSAIKTLVEFVHEPDLLVYIKQLDITLILQKLVDLPYESIIYHVYILLSYIMTEDNIKSSEKESGRLLSNILDSLRKNIKLLSEKGENIENIKHDIALLLEAVQGFVQHDQMKSEILKQNALTLLIDSCDYLHNTSKRLLLDSLGSISFDKEAAQIIRENTQFINSIENIQSTSSNGIKKAAENIIWNVIKEPEYREKVVEREQKTTQVEFTDRKKEVSTKRIYEYDFMISYCHVDKELVCKIQEFLVEQGFKVWFDRDNMYGPAMQAMADAVENSEFIIMCLSDSYKRSVYCQVEAEYAFNCKRFLLPIIVRHGYRPDGWLGLLLGSRIYINFARFEFNKACQLLLNEVKLQRKNHRLNLKGINPEDMQGHLEPLTPKTKSNIKQFELTNEYINRDTSKFNYRSIPLSLWTHKDILDFLYDTNLHLMMPLCESMTGYGLIKLFKICQEKPSEFYNQLNNELNTQFNGLNLPLAIFTQFLGEIDRLVGSYIKNIEPTPPKPKTPPPLPPPSVLVKNIIVPPSAPSSLPRRFSAPAPLLPSPQNTISSTYTTTQTTHDIQFIGENSNQIDSFIQSSDIISSILPEQTEYDESTLNFTNETSYQYSQTNVTPYQSSYEYDTHFVTQTYVL